ncbi:Zinicin-like metallopeptidase [Frankineae bacterium MT45]|nr:Zinicin-like metallopeptidase [Frankineae bacterium MT45]
MRGVLAPSGVPISRTRAQSFDEVVLDAVEHLESHWPGELDGIEFAVDDVPVFATADDIEFDTDVVADHGVALGRLLRPGGRDSADSIQPVVLIYRRPIEARTATGDERSSLVFAVVAELVAQLNGKDVDDIHPL